MDGERAVAMSGEAAAYFRRKGIKLHIRAPGQHARLVERRQAVLRDALHKIDEQLVADGLGRVPIEQRVTEATFCGNALLSINNVTPYNAVYGRVPTLLPDINSSLPDGEGLDTRLEGDLFVRSSRNACSDGGNLSSSDWSPHTQRIRSSSS